MTFPDCVKAVQAITFAVVFSCIGSQSWSQDSSAVELQRYAQAKKSGKPSMAKDLPKLEAHLRKVLNPKIRLVPRAGRDNAEMFISDEFIGVLFPDDDGYELRIVILQEELQ